MPAQVVQVLTLRMAPACSIVWARDVMTDKLIIFLVTHRAGLANAQLSFYHQRAPLTQTLCEDVTTT